MLLNLTVVGGDGIGPEVTEQAIGVLEAVAAGFGHELKLMRKNIGGAALAASNDPLPPDTLEACLSAGAVLLGAVGSPVYDKNPGHLRPEAGLLRLRKELGAFANLRPAVCFPALVENSPLRAEVVKGTDILLVRELLGGLYFGQPRSLEGEAGSRQALNTMRYELARGRKRKVLSVDKANVLECSRLWRDVVTRVGAQFPDVKLAHQYVDSAAMLLVQHPTEVDVLLTENMFGDILSDQAGGVVGGLGLLASASIGGPVGLYEPVHGSAPDIAGKGIANPLGAILSAAMLLRHSFRLEREAACIESAVQAVLGAGHRTRDLAQPGHASLSTSEMGRKVAEAARTGSSGSSGRREKSA
jgi:3-isopropylmalate dehydrogenase